MLFPDLPDPPKTTAQAKSVRQALRDAALAAVRTLKDALTESEPDMVRVRAACAILDRAGYGPHATVAVEDGRDLSRLSAQELFERAERVRQAIECMTDEERDSSSTSVH